MNRKVPVRFGAGEKVEITSKPYLLLWPLCKRTRISLGGLVFEAKNFKRVQVSVFMVQFDI